MKKLIVLLGIVLFSTAAYGSFEGISILSQEHHVSGYAGGTGAITSYDQTETSLVSGSASALWPGPNPGTNGAGSSAGDFGVTAVDLSRWTFTGSWALAESTYVFSPLATNLQFQYAGSVEMHAFENKVWARVFDITDNLLVDYRQWTTELSSGLTFNESADYTLNLEHQYELQLYAKVFAGDNPGVTSSLEVSIVPEPCSLILLGLGGLVLLRCRA